MRQNGMLLARHTGRRKGRLHDGKVIVMRSNLRWCSDGFEITCWNGDLVRLAFIIDAHDREIIAWHAVANAGISGSMVRDMMLEAVETRFAAIQAPQALEWLTDNGSVYTAARDPGLRDRPQSRPLLHSRSKPGIERHLRELRQNLQARLCSRQPSSGCDHRTPADRRMVRGLQRKPSPFWAQDALPKGVHPSSITIAECPVKRGQLQLTAKRSKTIPMASRRLQPRMLACLIEERREALRLLLLLLPCWVYLPSPPIRRTVARSTAGLGPTLPLRQCNLTHLWGRQGRIGVLPSPGRVLDPQV